MDLRESTIEHLIIHKIVIKDYTELDAKFSENTTPIDSRIETMLKSRITDACGNPSRAFSVEIEENSKF